MSIINNLYYDAYNKRWVSKEYIGTITTHGQDGHSGTFYVVETRKIKMNEIVIGGLQNHQAIKTDGICTCLTSAMGCGGDMFQ